MFSKIFNWILIFLALAGIFAGLAIGEGKDGSNWGFASFFTGIILLVITMVMYFDD